MTEIWRFDAWARTQVLEVQASERRILVQLYCLQSETWEQAEMVEAGRTFTAEMYVQTEA